MDAASLPIVELTLAGVPEQVNIPIKYEMRKWQRAEYTDGMIHIIMHPSSIISDFTLCATEDIRADSPLSSESIHSQLSQLLPSVCFIL
jgi:hypothetical protein